MFNLSGSELVFLVLIALVVLGPDKLPEAMRKAGKAYADFKRMTSGFQSEMKSVLDEPLRELRETAEMAKKAATFDINPLSTTPSTPTPATTNGTPAGQKGVGPTDLTAAKNAADATPVVGTTTAAAAAATASADVVGSASVTDPGAPPMLDPTSRRLAARQPATPEPATSTTATTDVAAITPDTAVDFIPNITPDITAVAGPKVVDAVVASGMMTGFDPTPVEPTAEEAVAE